MKYEDIITYLEAQADPDAVKGMVKVAITGQNVYGVSLPVLRALAKKIGKDHELALKLWQNNNRETRILAPMINEPKRVTEKQMESWVLDFDSWEVCDQCCMNLFEKLPFIHLKAKEWAKREEEFVKRTGFVLMARLAVSDKNAGDDIFNEFFPY
ncbi:MAG: DNA alkylation repair protein, partial [Candidatus Aminicenantes bacterium]|nr:DNA alkylation repair protein [Candidatus Aminicenantes bacterium]